MLSRPSLGYYHLFLWNPAVSTDGHSVLLANSRVPTKTILENILPNSEGCFDPYTPKKTGPFQGIRNLSDPGNRNHKSLAIGNHNFEVASFSRRNRSKIAVSQSQKSHWAKKIAAIRNHTLVVATYFGGFPDPCGASETL